MTLLLLFRGHDAGVAEVCVEFQIASGIDDSHVSSLSVSDNTATEGNIGGGAFPLFLDRFNQSLLFRGMSELVGATITSAVLQVQAFSGNNGITTKIRAEDVDDPSPLANGQTEAQFLALARTTAGVDWDVAPATWTPDTSIDSPDISSVIQEIVDRPGFDDKIHILWDEDGGGELGIDTIFHFDLDPDKAPILRVCYIPAVEADPDTLFGWMEVRVSGRMHASVEGLQQASVRGRLHVNSEED